MSARLLADNGYKLAPVGKAPSALAEPCHMDLDPIVAELREIRNASRKRRYLDGHLPSLPSRQAMAAIVEGLVAIMFPRIFGPPGLAEENTDGFVVGTLSTLLPMLTEQVRAAIELTAATTGEPASDSGRRAAEVTAEFARDLPRVRTLVDTDIHAAYTGDPAARSVDEVVFCYPGVTAVIRHRLAHLLYRLGAPLLARIVAEAAHSETGIDIHPGAEIGESFFIDHGTGVVIGETAIIGRRVRLYQAVTLGAKRFATDETGALAKGGARHPIIEDDVVIYAGATILGRVTIGRGSTIGGNVWLTHDVPPGSHVTQAKLQSEVFDAGGGI